MVIQSWIKINKFAQGTIKFIVPSQEKVSLIGAINRIQQVTVRVAFVLKLDWFIQINKNTFSPLPLDSFEILISATSASSFYWTISLV